MIWFNFFLFWGFCFSISLFDVCDEEERVDEVVGEVVRIGNEKSLFRNIKKNSLSLSTIVFLLLIVGACWLYQPLREEGD